MHVVATRQLRRVFGDTVALAGLDLTVAPGEVFGLVGPDGAGKTTALRLLAGVLAPTAGAVEVAGHDVGRDPVHAQEHLGYMSQRFGLYPDLTVLENIHFYADLYGVPSAERDRRLERLLEFSGLAPFRDRFAGRLSGGMKQKLGLCCALIHTPRVLLLDEPTNGVDPVSRRDFWRILHQLLAEGVTIVVATAYLDEAERCSRVALLDHGRVIALGAPAEVRARLPGTMLEVLTNHPRRAARLLAAELPAASVSLFGDRVHVVTADPAGDEARIRELLRAAGQEIRSLAPAPPSLEDVFVAALSGPGRDALTPP